MPIMDMQPIQLHRALCLEGSHSWFNDTDAVLKVLIIFEYRASI